MPDKPTSPREHRDPTPARQPEVHEQSPVNPGRSRPAPERNRPGTDNPSVNPARQHDSTPPPRENSSTRSASDRLDARLSLTLRPNEQGNATRLTLDLRTGHVSASELSARDLFAAPTAGVILELEHGPAHQPGKAHPSDLDRANQRVDDVIRERMAGAAHEKGQGSHHRHTDGHSHHGHHTSHRDSGTAQPGSSPTLTDMTPEQRQQTLTQIHRELGALNQRLSQGIDSDTRSIDEARRTALHQVISIFENDRNFQPSSLRPDAVSDSFHRMGFSPTGVQIRLTDEGGQPLRNFNVAVTFIQGNVERSREAPSTVTPGQTDQNGVITLPRESTLVPRSGTLHIRAESSSHSAIQATFEGIGLLNRNANVLSFDAHVIASTTTNADLDQRNNSRTDTTSTNVGWSVGGGVENPQTNRSINFDISSQRQWQGAALHGTQQQRTTTRPEQGRFFTITQVMQNITP